ncbi:MAG: hypothetical protein RR523_11865 [Cetobacterium sp.]|uniref:hypothetical protein n=1 Tax=Cetobacterium sp. TaxID=2071632 RepID=UPI002FC7DFBE
MLELEINEFIELKENPVDLYQLKKLFGLNFLYRKRCSFVLTNKRIVLNKRFGDVVEILINEIEKIEKCYIGFPIIGIDKMIPFFPIGLNIFLKNGMKYKIAFTFKRNKVYENVLKNIERN